MVGATSTVAADENERKSLKKMEQTSFLKYTNAKRFKLVSSDTSEKGFCGGDN